MASASRVFAKVSDHLKRLAKRGGRPLRWLLVAVGATLAFFLISIVALNTWLNSGVGRDMLTGLLQEQTGAEVRIDAIEANLPRGGTLTGLSLRLPQVNGNLESAPSIRVKQIRVRASLSSLLYGTLRLKEAIVDGLEVHAVREDGVLWVAGLQKFLESKTPPAPKEAPASAPADPGKPFVMADLETMTRKVFVPFRIKIEEVGLRSAVFTFKDIVKGKTTQTLRLAPIHVLFGMTAWMRSSHLWVKLSGAEGDGNLRFEYEGSATPLVKQDLELKAAFSIDDLRELKASVETKQLAEDLDVKLELSLSSNYETVHLSKLDVTLGRILKNHGEAKIHFPDGRTDKLSIELLETADVNLNGLSPYLKPFKIETSGSASLSHLKVNGLLDAPSLSKIDTAVLPAVDLKLATKDLSVQMVEASAKNLNTSITLRAEPAAGGGILATEEGTVRLDELRIKAPGKVPGAQTEVTARNIHVDSKIKVKDATNLKSLGVEEFGVVTSIEKITLKSPEGGTLQTGLSAKIDVTSESLMTKTGVRASLEVGPYLTGGLSLDCKEECKELHFGSKLTIPSLEKLLTLVTPALGQAASSLPVVRGGSFTFDAAVHGTMPAGPIAKIAERVRKAKGTVAAETHLKDLDVIHTPTKVTAEGVGLDVVIKGAIEKQTLRLRSGVKSLQSAALPKPLLNNEFNVSLRVEDLAKVTLDQLAADIPSLGASVNANAEAEITDTKEPRNIAFHMTAKVSPESAAAGIAAIEASGEAVTLLDVKAKNLKEFDVSGEVKLQNFSAKVPQPKDAETNVALVSIEQMNGSFPFRQHINLKDFKAPGPPKDQPIDEPSKPVPRLENQLSKYLNKHKDSETLADSRMKVESYGEVRPTTQLNRPVTAERIAFKDLAISQIEIDAELSQNMFSLNQMVFTLLGGKVQASAQVTFDTTLRKARLTGQCTELDTRKLADSFPKLKDKMQSFSLLGSSPYIDGTLRLLYDAPSGDISGGLEVTRIGKDQMRAVLLYVDPEETNPTISTMRKALSVGEVRQVSIPIRNGQIGLDLDVRLFAAPIPTPKLQRFPLSQLVRNFTNKQAPDSRGKEDSAKNSEQEVR